MSVKRIRHIGIVVSNLNKSVEALKSLLGAKVITNLITNKGSYIDTLVGLRGTTSKVKLLKLKDNSRIELLEYKKPKGKKRSNKSNEIGVSHFAVTIDSMSKFVKKSKKFGTKFINKPILSPDKFVKVAYVLILNEIFVEVVEVLNKKAEFSGGK
jgi:catechol 2,3-dioxygenase-like lactoylglutathione lyase family enzyme